MDIAVNLVESYLRMSGYLTLSEFEVQRRTDIGYEAVTDVDIMALRLPGDVHAPDSLGPEESRLLLLHDPVLQLEPEMTDVIIGEVKQGEAEFNPGIRRHIVLHTMLRRVGWLYEEPLEDVVAALQEDLIRISPARGGGSIRTRLVAFGRAPRCDLNTISHSHVVETLLRFFEGTDDAFKPVQFRDPAPAMLSLLLKTGFQLNRDD
jgi:hypothetical protein